MGSNVSVFHDGWQKTGSQVLVDQYEMNFTVTWTDDEDVDQEWSGTVTFPNILADVPTPWLKEVLYDLTVKAAKKKLGAYQGDES